MVRVVIASAVKPLVLHPDYKPGSGGKRKWCRTDKLEIVREGVGRVFFNERQLRVVIEADAVIHLTASIGPLNRLKGNLDSCSIKCL